MKSVKSINQCQFVIQTIYDIVKTHGGELKVETKEEEALSFLFSYQIICNKYERK